ncbi:MAG: SGNH/GDSL hydrolase family protein [Burkholderiales bacterium]
MNRSSFARLISAGAIALVTLAALPAHAGPFGALYVFGDSLSDDGNNAALFGTNPGQIISGNSYIPSQPYAAGTYSNGQVWANYYASLLGVPLTASLTGGGDFAFGGATTGAGSQTPSLLAQASQYLGGTGGVAQANALYVVAGGGNNARAALTAIGGGANAAATIAATAAAFASDIGTIVDELQAAGAQHIVVWNTPNLGLAPAVVAGGGAQLGSFLAGAMNTALAARLSGEAGVTTFDLFGFGSQLAANPAAFGFTNVIDACGAIANANCSQYAYWDGIHPTTAAHMALADAMWVATVPEPETYALMAFGLVAVAWGTRRRAKAAVIVG